MDFGGFVWRFGFLSLVFRAFVDFLVVLFAGLWCCLVILVCDWGLGGWDDIVALVVVVVD